jgi:hypothetical protein
MIVFDVFAYSEPEWDQIEVAVRDALSLDADQIERVEIERTVGSSWRGSRRTLIAMPTPKGP